MNKSKNVTHILDRNAVRDVIADSGFRSALAHILAKMRAPLGGDRFSMLTQALATSVSSLSERGTIPRKLLDFGCGNMAISEYLVTAGVVETTVGVDTYPAPALSEEKFCHYKKIDDATQLPFSTQSFDVTICVDVLHHIGIEASANVLRELGRVSKFIVVKDHFEFGFISRHLLRLADWYGNYAYGVNVPDRYYTEELWSRTLQAAGLKEVFLEAPLRIHKGVFGLIVRPKNHFISILTTSYSP